MAYTNFIKYRYTLTPLTSSLKLRLFKGGTRKVSVASIEEIGIRRS
jgi:hypothetical protein